MERIMAYDWPGNVRELHNGMERGVILADNNVIIERCLPIELLGTKDGQAGATVSLFSTLEELEKNYILKVINHVDGNRSKAAEILGIAGKPCTVNCWITGNDVNLIAFSWARQRWGMKRCEV